MKNLVRNAVSLLLPAALIVWSYPPTTYFKNFDFPFAVTFVSYAVVYVLVLAVVVVLAPVVARQVHTSPIRRAALQAIAATAAFAAIAIVFGPIGCDVPGTRLNGIFFSEWKFTNFFFYVGFPVAVITSAMVFLTHGDEQRGEEVR